MIQLSSVRFSVMMDSVFTRIMVALCLAIVATPSHGAVPQDVVVQLSAQTVESPPSITLRWLPRATVNTYWVYRRADNEANWIQQGSALAGSATSYVDTNVTVGTRYEYKVVGGASDTSSYGYIYSGIDAPLEDNRGKLLLIVDNTMSTPLQAELTRLEQDLAGDGWQVIRHDVSRTAQIYDVKAIIQTDYAADPSNVKSVFLFGHIPMFMSGGMAPDGHANRPWPGDGYYGDMDGTWTPGVTTYFPSKIELQVGRVDLWNLPTFTTITETELLRRYLNKDHNYRSKLFNVQQRGMIDDKFGWFNGEAFAQNGWRFAPIVGAANIDAVSWTGVNPSTPYLWGDGCSYGNNPGDCSNVVTTAQMKTTDPAIFTFLFGSYLGQWDAADALIKAELATANYGLTCAWAGRPNWFVHHMGLGKPIGLSTLVTQNNYGSEVSYNASGIYSGGVHVGLMGDPTLRAFMIAPAGPVTAIVDDLGQVDLSWGASSDSVLGYNVYRSSQLDGPYTKLNADILPGLTYHDSSMLPGMTYYMVRSVRLETTPSGTFYNAGQGVLTTCTVPDLHIPTGGLKLWVNASKRITTDTGGRVSLWGSQGGVNDVSQSISALQPLLVPNDVNGQPAVRFDGSDDVLGTTGPVISGAGTFTIAAVVRPGSVTPPSTILWQGDGTSTGGYGLYMSGDSRIRAGWGGSTSEIASSGAAIPGRWYLLETSYDLANHKMWINGSLAGSSPAGASNFSSGVFSIGNYGPSPTMGFGGDIAEVFAYDHALSDTDRAGLESYLKGKYGRPVPVFTSTPAGGISPVNATFDAGSSYDPDGSITSYSWDFGDGTTGSGIVVTHSFTALGTYNVTLTLTDNDGLTSSITNPLTVYPGVSSVSISGDPVPPVSPTGLVTLHAASVGGYQVLYKFLVNDGSGWQTLRDFDTAAYCSWTPGKVGDFQMKVQAKSTGSLNLYDVESSPISYIVDNYPFPSSGLALWLRADAGVGLDGQGKVSSWLDESGAGNNVTQTIDANKPVPVYHAFEDMPAIRFAGGSQGMQSAKLVLSGTTAFTAFTVGRFNSLPGVYQYLWWNGQNSVTAGYGCYVSGMQKLRSAWGSQSNYLGDTNPATLGTWYRMTSTYSSGAHQVWLNGTGCGTSPMTDSNFNAGGVFCVGNMGCDFTKGFFGDIGEIILFNRVLSDPERLLVEQYISGRWTTPAFVSTDRISVVKSLRDWTPVSITIPKVVTAASACFIDGTSYIEEPDRSCGMKLTGASLGLWENVTLTGVVKSDSNGEKMLQVTSIDTRLPGSELRVLGMGNSSTKASGLLVRIWGRVSDRSSDHFILDDGGGTPVRVELGGLASGLTVDVQNDYYAAVTGVAGLGSGGVKVVRPRGDSDIRVY